MISKCLFGLVLACFLGPFALGSYGPRSLVSNFDSSYYHPTKYGLKDLAFEVRVEGLTKNLKERLSIGKIKDVYFRVYWILPGKFEIRVVGLPKGFKHIRAELKKLIWSRLDFVIPVKLKDKLRSYALSASKAGKYTMVRAVDKTRRRENSEIHLEFDKSGKLRSHTSYGPRGTKAASYKMSSKMWSQNKWVVEKLEVLSREAGHYVKITTDITYTSVGGHGFPRELKISTEIGKDATKSKNAVTKSSKITFDKYRINSGDAYKEIVLAKRKKPSKPKK